MTPLRASKACAALLAMVYLNGCVAAAIPALAGAAMVRTETNGNEGPQDTAGPTSGAPVIEHQLSAVTKDLAQPNPSIASDKAFFGPAPAPPDASLSTGSRLHDGYSALFDYIENDALDTSSPGGLTSAVLANPSALDGKRAQCLTETPTVLIDLDPHSQPSAKADGEIASPVLGEQLSKLRELDVEIAWISERSAAEAGEIRKKLKRTGIDPDGSDQLILMRYPGDRKQTRRSDLTKANCIVAIVGDNREDFDELYEYLVRPDSALTLELLIGKGWFLAPSVLSQGEI